ncbi:uncharacterized protein LOC126770635 isoform X2 [Nymphalis io]|uniref:uncharacterized protein LOC126770635 isoform X2 n=1 Tax=Inachis io TaxID=171585 RepID=UPI00216723EF|nr:uncharacterized protein LOC126770635 isoform X2 [Nymphalis io]
MIVGHLKQPINKNHKEMGEAKNIIDRVGLVHNSEINQNEGSSIHHEGLLTLAANIASLLWITENIRAIVDTLECYMDDLVECFEDFVKKSLFVISFGIGLIIALLAYILKIVQDRPPTPHIIAEAAVNAQYEIRNMEQKNDQSNGLFNKFSQKASQKDILNPNESRVQTTTAVNTIPRLQPMPSYDEQVLREIGFSSCSKSGCRRRFGNNNDIPSRVPVPSFPSPTKYRSIHSLLLSKHNISSSQLCSKTK